MLIALLAVMPLSGMAQDDDLYFNPKAEAKKAEAERKEMARRLAEQRARRDSIYALYWSGSNRNVDEYNRGGKLQSRYQHIGADSLGNDIISFQIGRGMAPDSIYDEDAFVEKYMKNGEDDFSYTKDLSRWDGFYDPWFYDYYGYGPYYWRSTYWGWRNPWRYGYWGGWYDPWYDPWYYGYAGWYGDPWYWGWGGYRPWYWGGPAYVSYGGFPGRRNYNNPGRIRGNATNNPGRINNRTYNNPNNNYRNYPNRTNPNSQFGNMNTGAPSYGGGSFGGGVRGGGSFGGGRPSGGGSFGGHRR